MRLLLYTLVAVSLAWPILHHSWGGIRAKEEIGGYDTSGDITNVTGSGMNKGKGTANQHVLDVIDDGSHGPQTATTVATTVASGLTLTGAGESEVGNPKMGDSATESSQANNGVDKALAGAVVGLAIFLALMVWCLAKIQAATFG